jgi:hypothetical protein
VSYVIAAPEMMTAAATDLAGIGSDLNAAHLAAAAPTVSLIPAAADEVSAAVTHLFSGYAQDFHGLVGKAATFHDQFVQTLKSGAHAYTGAEAAATASLKPAAGLPGLPALPDFSGLWNNFLNFLNSLTSGFSTAVTLLLIYGIGGLFWGTVILASFLNAFFTNPLAAIQWLLALPSLLHL